MLKEIGKPVVYHEVLKLSRKDLEQKSRSDLNKIAFKAGASALVIETQILFLADQGFGEGALSWMRIEAKKYRNLYSQAIGVIKTLPKTVFEGETLEAITKRRRLRHQLGDRDGWICHYCAVALSKTGATLDHKIPQSQGGGDSLENCVLSCEKCNRAKGSLSYESFIQQIQVSKIAC